VEKLKSKLDEQLKVLLRDWGYQMKGEYLYSKAFCGLPERCMGIFKSTFAACEHLIPIISDKKFHDRFKRICDKGKGKSNG